jgi:hypothetical protein
MVERRSLGAAMEMTPEKLAFISGQTKTAASAPVAPPAKTEAKTIDVEVSPQELQAVSEPAPSKTRRSARRAPQETPGASEVLDQVLVPVTIRLPHRTAQALRRAHLEQRLKHAKPDTQQDIAEEALGEWLSRQGFLD